MNLMWLCIMPLLSMMTLVISDQKIDTSQIRVFPATSNSIAGVFQVSYINYLNQPEYAFNASEARELCWSLGLTIASKAQVNEALTLGLETCRFGWTDEHFAVIPRIKASETCGQNKTGLVLWRTSVKKKFDVFCFNESAMVTQLKDTAADSPSTSRENPEYTPFPPEATTSTSNLQSTSTAPLVKSTPSLSLSSLLSLSVSSSASLLPHPNSVDTEAEPPQSRSSAQGFIGVPAKALLITSTCALLLIAVAILAYIKLNNCSFLSWDVKQQEEYIETEEWKCVKNIKDAQKDAPEEVRIEVGNNAT
ncbi:lymphatic vessel endothelial hyaluronic acid receptor 1a [Centroberyx affinis]|uniref:lymphatic vessel endothelial hyaluronic acid receptor 1a n=1 Tax=Centroberyx affinis TaxID=166261 RepID=UPI003A5C464B